MRNLDLSTLRSFVAVADTGGVTRAAAFLNLTQSAVSMQIKRLEELLDAKLLERSGRGIALTPTGEQLLGYARRLVALNDEAVGKLMDTAFEGEVQLGVPHDVIYPVIPQVLKRFNALYPRVRVNLVSSHTRHLKHGFGSGDYDLIVTTETEMTDGGETLHEMDLVWVGAQGGASWRQSPLRVAFGKNCIFRGLSTAALNDAGLSWDTMVESDSDRTIEATVSADLAVTVLLDGTQPGDQEVIQHNGALPMLPTQKINLYGRSRARAEYVSALADMVSQGFLGLRQTTLRAVG